MNEGPAKALPAVRTDASGHELASHSVSREYEQRIPRWISHHHHRPLIGPLRVLSRARAGRRRDECEHTNRGAHRAPPPDAGASGVPELLERDDELHDQSL